MIEVQTRPRVTELNRLINLEHSIPVGHDGFVRLVDYMGDDAAIVQAARVSYGAGTKQLREDRGLIRYLMRHWHTTPFEMCELKLHIRVPMHIMRQWIRHRTASVNEYSTRYSVAIDSAERSEGRWRKQSTTNKQGSSSVPFTPEEVALLTAQEEALLTYSRKVYEDRIEMGVAREQARKDLPLSTYTEAYWKIDLHNLFHFLRLRLHEHAQKEIREFGEAIRFYVERWVPLAYEAFVDYRLEGDQVSGAELELIRAMLTDPTTALEKIDDAVTLGILSKREGQELRGKLGL